EAKDSALDAVWVDEEAIRVIEPMVEMVARLVGETEAKLKAPVGERQPVDVEAQRSLSRLLVPAELAGVLDARSQEETRVRSKLVRKPRRRERPVGGDPYAQREGFPCKELPALGAIRGEQLDLGDARFAAPPLAQPGLALRWVALEREEAVVA